MEEITNSVFSKLNFPQNAKVVLKDKTLSITKWNWDFKDCENFQNEALEIINKNKDHKVFIFCNHPHCFTLGRGNERGEENLVEFDPKITNHLNYPVHKIHRGGGITFHYPGQWIFYPICSINENYTLDDHMCWILSTVKDVLINKYGVKNALSAKKLMGIWVERSKLASIGVGLRRFVTLHGLALNLVHDSLMFDELEKINPCGLNSNTYICLDQKIKLNCANLVEEFNESYTNSIV